MPQVKRPARVRPIIGLRAFHKRRNQVLITRGVGGLGDMFMHRMVFEDFKHLNPEVEIVFGILPQYFDAVKDHPYIDKLVDVSKTDPGEYVIHYNTTSCCDRYEISVAPLADKHRSDIWASHCGVTLTNHNMHILQTEQELEFGRKQLAKFKQPTVMLSPISAMASKNLMPQQTIDLVGALRDRGLFVFATHNKPIPTLRDLDVPVLCDLNTREWMAVVTASDYVVSVDTAAFHFAGGIGKPVVGIFTWADGYVYGKYYPTATIVQLHRNTHPEWKCGPCYRWPDCPFTKKSEKPCLTNLTPQMMIAGVETMLNKQKFLPICN